jgi:hypothetical protein
MCNEKKKRRRKTKKTPQPKKKQYYKEQKKCFVFFSVPQQPSISSVSPKSDTELTVTWTLAAPSPGNVTYSVTVMEAEDNTKDVFVNKTVLQNYGILSLFNTF